MNAFLRIARRVGPWIVLWLSAPISGLVAFLALGPVSSPALALLGGAIIGLGIGAAQAWVLHRRFLRWMAASALGLGVGSALALIVAGLLPDSPAATLLGAAVAGLTLGAAQLFTDPPTGRILWLAIVTIGWVIAWGVSLTLAISAEQGFLIFGSTGSLVFVVLLALTLRLRQFRSRAAGATVSA